MRDEAVGFVIGQREKRNEKTDKKRRGEKRLEIERRRRTQLSERSGQKISPTKGKKVTAVGSHHLQWRWEF